MSLKALDIASHQAAIDFDIAAAQGYEIAVIKASGGRIYGNPERQQQTRRARSAKVNGLPRGLDLGYYHYQYEPTSGAGSAQSEFDNFATAIDDLVQDGVRLYIDVEEVLRAAWGLSESMTEHIVNFARLVRAEYSCPLGAYIGTYFWEENAIDTAALVAEGVYLWLPSWQDTPPGLQYTGAWGVGKTEITEAYDLWQNTSQASIGGMFPVDGDVFFPGTRADWTARGVGFTGKPTSDPYAYLRVPFGPLDHTVHPFFHGDYSLDKYGYPLGPAAQYSDGLIRQTFERGVFGSNGRGNPSNEAAGQALRHALGDPASTIADYPSVHPLI